MNKQKSAWLLAALMGSGLAHAQVAGINDDLTGATVPPENWTAINGACLTAGTAAPHDGTSSIPACHKLPYYTGKFLNGGVTGALPDPRGRGALRLTNGDRFLSSHDGTGQFGGVVSNTTVGSGAGLDITFTTVTYGGNALLGAGADGMSFFMADSSAPPSLGARGGSLGYSCNNTAGTGSSVSTQTDGVIKGYLGIGIDEYGNYVNSIDATDTDLTTLGQATWVDRGPNRISLRGGGNVNTTSLNERFPNLYPLPDPKNADPNYLRPFYARIEDACRTGRAADAARTRLANYPLISSTVVPTVISNQQAISDGIPMTAVRGLAKPITYHVKLGQDGLVDFSYSINGGSETTVVSQQDMVPFSGPLPENLRFGFGGASGGGSNVHEITCFKATPPDLANNSAGGNVQQAGKVQAGTQVFLGFYHPVNWWGEMRAQDLLLDSNDAVTIDPLANWNANCNLSGGACAQSKTSPVTRQMPSDRSLLTWNPATRSGVPLQWSSLDITQTTKLGGKSDRLDYLRGETSKQFGKPGGTYRFRTGMLGDVQNSGPVWVGPANSRFEPTWQDKLQASVSMPENGVPYADFVKRTADRTHVVYVGANDGFLHGFRAGAYDAADNTRLSPAVPNDGREVLGYMPNAAIQTLVGSPANFDYTSQKYAHNTFVDGSPGTGDVFYNGAWHTWLVSGLGTGGNAAGPAGTSNAAVTSGLFALDVTDPSRFSESNAASLVMGDWVSSTLACVDGSACGKHLGSVQSAPLIRRLHDGNWAAILGNGLNSEAGDAGIFVMHIASATGATSIRYLSAGTGSGPRKDGAGAIVQRNGIAAAQSADLDGDHIVDFVYAGDLLGNLWRFDLTDSDPSKWSSSTMPLLTTSSDASKPQPISTRVTQSVVRGVGPAGEQGVLIAFGTGQQFSQTQTAASNTIVGTTQSIYGVWDWDLASWNTKADAKSQYAKLATAPSLTPANLLTQTISPLPDNRRELSTNKLCWAGRTDCASGNTHYGWKVDLPALNEQVVFDPVAIFGRFVVNTLVPVTAAQAVNCGPALPVGFSMAVALGDGGGGKESFYPDALGDFPTTKLVSGVALSGVGTPWFVNTPKGRTYQITQTVGGSGATIRVKVGSPGPGKRITWIKRR